VCSLAQLGESVISKNSKLYDYCDSWVLDSGATNYMTRHNSIYFDTYKPSLGNRRIIIADESFVTIAKQEHISLSHQLTLKDVIYVPKLSTNLCSIHQLTKFK